MGEGEKVGILWALCLPQAARFNVHLRIRLLHPLRDSVHRLRPCNSHDSTRGSMTTLNLSHEQLSDLIQKVSALSPETKSLVDAMVVSANAEMGISTTPEPLAAAPEATPEATPDPPAKADPAAAPEVAGAPETSLVATPRKATIAAIVVILVYVSIGVLVMFFADPQFASPPTNLTHDQDAEQLSLMAALCICYSPPNPVGLTARVHTRGAHGCLCTAPSCVSAQTLRS